MNSTSLLLLPSDLASLPDRARDHFHFWRAALEPILELDRGIYEALGNLAMEIRKPVPTVRKKYYAVKNHGWEALIERRYCPELWNRGETRTISAQDKEIVKTYCEQFQRSSAAAIRKMRADYRKGIVQTDTPLNVETGFPYGWSEGNLKRFVPTKYELKNARIGRSAADSHRQLVYTTRRDLWVGSHYLFDDMWHDHMVNQLDQRKTGRPLEFHGLDLYSANKFAWGMRVRLEREDGTMEGLKESDMRFLLATVFDLYGYSARGTTLVVEHGTAAIREDLEKFLFEETGGLVTVARSGMSGAAAAAHQYAGRAKGNFRFKAALESLGNLIHNEMAYLPAQTGRNVENRPEGLHGLLKRNDALICALAQLEPERAEMLRWPMLTIQQFRMIASEIYQRINERTDHDLEGWDLLYRPDTRLGGMRRMSPAEVFRAGQRHLVRLRPQAIAAILLADDGVERNVRRGMIETRDGEISGDVLRYNASLLREGEKYRTILNPYSPNALYCFDAAGRFVASIPRINSIDRADVAALQEQCGRVAREEAAALAPFRARHMAEARQKKADMRWNTSVVSGAPMTEEERSRSRTLRDLSGSASELLDDTQQEESFDEGVAQLASFDASDLL